MCSFELIHYVIIQNAATSSKVVANLILRSFDSAFLLNILLV